MALRTNAIDRLVSQLSALSRPATSCWLGTRPTSPSTANRLITLFRQTELECNDWLPYALVDPAAPYTRNLIARLPNDDKLMLLVWAPGKQSPIHSHANTHCVMKMLSGRLSETLYRWPQSAAESASLSPNSSFRTKSETFDSSPAPLPVLADRQLQSGQTTYIADEMGVHRIRNPDSRDYAVSMHLYTTRPEMQPRHVSLFDDVTGAPVASPPMRLHSERGLVLAP